MLYFECDVKRPDNAYALTGHYSICAMTSAFESGNALQSATKGAEIYGYLSDC
jgi:hypothetical protein